MRRRSNVSVGVSVPADRASVDGSSLTNAGILLAEVGIILFTVSENRDGGSDGEMTTETAMKTETATTTETQAGYSQ
jgi:hypothetical protein